jgi:tetratricopeptide (TPR) repeat protein
MKRQYLTSFWLYLILCIVCVNTLAAMTKDEIHFAFTEANDAFSRANKMSDDSDQAQSLYQRAIIGYEKIVEAGRIHNAMLYCNLANSYLLTDDLGRAILNYRRAQHLDSSNPDIHKNLNFARSKRTDQFTVTTQKKILERLFFWHYDFSMQTRFVMGGIGLSVLCIWLILRIWIIKWHAVIPVCSVMLLLLIGMIASVAVQQHRLSTHRSGVIVADSVVARQGDSDNYPESFSESLHAGIEFDVIEQRPNWLHVKLSSDQDTWIPAYSAELI